MKEFQYCSFFTKYSCSGEFEIKNNSNRACFAQVVEILTKIRKKFTETYSIRCYDASDEGILRSRNNNKCFLGQKELLNHVRQLKSIMDIKEISVKKVENYFLVTATITACETSHHYFLNWIRRTYEFPFNMFLLHARKLRKELFTESIFNLYNIVAYAYRRTNYSHDIGCGGTLFTVDELRERLVFYRKGAVNGIFPTKVINYKGRLLNPFYDLEDWQDEKMYKKRRENYLEIYKSFKEANEK